MNDFPRRLYRLSFIIFALLAAILARLFWLQVYQHDRYDARASAQQGVTVTLKAQRGEILVHEKDSVIPVATTKQGWLLSMNPKLVKDPEALYEALSKIMPIQASREEFLAKAKDKSDPYEAIAHRISLDQKDAIAALHLDGINFASEDWRFYPAGDFASQTIGFVGADGEGKYGLERFFNQDFEGSDGVFQAEETSGGRLLLFARKLISPKHNGASIVTTIDVGVQTYLEKELANVVSTYHAESAGGLIVEPKTGRILAMASTPSFNPNEYSKEKNIGVFKNPSVESLFEMGSIIKPLTMAAAIDAGVVTPETTYNDTGERTIDTKTIRNYDGKARGVVPMQQILSQSLNMGAVFLMEQLGKDRFRDYMARYGIAEKTGIDLPAEAMGDSHNLKSTREIEYATAAFGQGISMTPLEVVRALSIIATGGLKINERIVDEIRYDDGSVAPRKHAEPERVLKEDSAHTVTRMLVEVVDKKLANGKGKIPGYSVAAKTGTAQIAGTTGGGYSGQFLHTFFGFGPAYDPKFLVFLFVEKPQGVQYASETLTQPFRSIIQYLFSYYEIPPDRPQELAGSQ